MKRNKNKDNDTSTKSEDFYPAFEKSLQESETFARDSIKSAFTDILTKLSRELEPQRNKLLEIIPQLEEAKVEEIEEKFGEREAELAATIYFLSNDPLIDDPEKNWQEAIFEESQLEDSSIIDNVNNMFPLARAGETYQSQVFDWSPKKNGVIPRAFNHQILVLRLRDTINDCIELHLGEYVGDTTKKVNKSLKGILDTIIPDLQELSKKEALLKCIAEDESESPIPPWLQNLSELHQLKL